MGREVGLVSKKPAFRAPEAGLSDAKGACYDRPGLLWAREFGLRTGLLGKL